MKIQDLIGSWKTGLGRGRRGGTGRDRAEPGVTPRGKSQRDVSTGARRRQGRTRTVKYSEMGGKIGTVRADAHRKPTPVRVVKRPQTVKGSSNGGSAPSGSYVHAGRSQTEEWTPQETSGARRIGGDRSAWDGRAMPRWSRICRMTAGWSMTAITRMVPPQCGHSRGSTS